MPPRRACDVCYKRKIQCIIKTRGNPCDWCSNQGLPCTFDRVIQKDPNKRTTSVVIQELSLRVEELEEALQSARSPNTSVSTLPSLQTSLPEASSNLSYCLISPSSAGNRSTHRGNSPPTQPTQSETSYKLSRCQLGNNWYFKGVGILSWRGRQWISESAGQRMFLENFDIFRNPVDPPPRPVSTVLPERSRALPPESGCRSLFDVFLKSKISIVFPVLERRFFEETIVRAYEINSPDLRRWASAKACLWAMLALVSRTEEAQQLEAIPEPEECVREVRSLLITINGAVNLDSLEATLLLWVYQKMKGQCREASIALTGACRIVCDLGGHFLLSEQSLLPQHIPIFDEQSRIHIRRLFWLCYCFDKDASLRTGSPPLLTSDFCDVDGTGEFSNQTSSYDQTRDIHLAKIKENTLRLLCSPRAFRYTDGELSSHVRHLDDVLEEWRLSVEPRFRPRLSMPQASSLSLPPAMSIEDRTHFIKLQLDYLFTVINIHTLVRKCGDLERNLPDDLHSVVQSSADLSIEAGRSIFRFLENVVDFWKEDSVWIVSHYAPMAAMPLFLNILIHPLGHPADDDLQILASVGNIARKIPTERLPIKEIEHIQEINDFVMELIRLCQSAAWKVKRGEREHDLDIIHR